ncbi:MAG: SAM-dependent methyltransferase [Thiothrix sp.]|nr:MAG: SAM-dependent methyltransferase [Thiothrix sp.]
MNFIENESAQKLRGGYYTPYDLAHFLARWVAEISPDRLLEPSCGDGVFFDAIGKAINNNKLSVFGFELEEEESEKAKLRARDAGLEKSSIINRDFLSWAIENFGVNDVQFDAVVGNPPFIRYQYLPEVFQKYAEQVFKKLDLSFTKHTNAWVPFILASMHFLRPGGRLAMVVPSEIIHVSHAQSLRSYLGRECKRLVIIDPEELWFSNTLQGAVIILAEKKQDKTDKEEGVGIYPVKGREFIKLNPFDVFSYPQAINGKTIQGKWTRAFLDKQTRLLIDELEEHKNVHRFRKIAQVDVGIVTGANKFFLVSDEVVEKHKLKKWAHPMFGRSEHCPGIIYDSHQHEENSSKGHPTNFLWFNETTTRIDHSAKEYIKMGESQSLHTRYKCRIRAPWYTVPSVYSTEIGMLKRSHNTPRLILNNIGAYTTDTAYRIRSNTVTAKQLVSCFINPLTALSAELEGRHYGGGVLELVPSEIERLLIPLPENNKVDLASLDNAFRNSSTEEILTTHGGIILNGIGLSTENQECLLNAWNKLKNRRQRISE